MLGTLEPENKERDQIAIANRLTACFSSMLLYWHQYVNSGKRIDTKTEDDSSAGHFLHLLHGKKPDELCRRAVDVSLILYAEHEFNASTFTARTIASTLPDFYSAVTGAIGALRGPLHGGANEAAMELLEKFSTPEEAENGILELTAAKKLVMGFGHRVYKISDPRSDVIKAWAKKLADAQGDKKLYAVSERIEQAHATGKEDVSQFGFLQRQRLPLLRHPDRDVHTVVRGLADHRLGCPYHRTARRQPAHSPQRRLRRSRAHGLRADGGPLAGC